MDVFWIGPDGTIVANWWNQFINEGQWNMPFPIAPLNAARIPS
jgi:hypothetical protein